MTDTAYDRRLRAILPDRPGRWLWARAKLYISAILLCVAGFFFVAGWMATGSTLYARREWLFIALQLVELIIVIVAIRGVAGYFARRLLGRSSDDSRGSVAADQAHHSNQ